MKKKNKKRRRNVPVLDLVIAVDPSTCALLFPSLYLEDYISIYESPLGSS